ncbi:hypothetical protein [Priestia megaterium]|uniref:hypothetical protein n=1 Tax=Priestia megaterium TaxID=1404 RepID=UPI00164A024C|nr:hypothetical protein [Priestia megaterium]
MSLGIDLYVSEEIGFWGRNISMVVFMVAIRFLVSGRKGKWGFLEGGRVLIIGILMMF